MDIATFSSKTAALLYDKAGVREPADLYTLKKETLLMLEGFKDKKAENLLQALDMSRHCTLDAFLFAVGIPGIGRVTARDIASHFGSLDKVRAATKEELMTIDEVGDVVAGSILDFFSDPYTVSVIDHLLKNGVMPKDAVQGGGKLENMTFVVTGTLPTLSRQQAEDMIRANGGTAASSVSRKTTYLLLGENPGSKYTKAQALHTPVLSEHEFLKMLS